MTPDDKQRREIERAVGNALQKVDWEQVPDDKVDKIMRGTVMGIVAWKLAMPVFQFVSGCIVLLLVAVVIALLWWSGLGANFAQHYDNWIKTPEMQQSSR